MGGVQARLKGSRGTLNLQDECPQPTFLVLKMVFLWSLGSLHSTRPSGGRGEYRPNFSLKDLPPKCVLVSLGIRPHPGRACSRKGWRCQAKSDFSVFPHYVSCQATVRAHAHSVQCFLANTCFWIEISSTSSTGPRAGLRPQLSHQLLVTSCHARRPNLGKHSRCSPNFCLVAF